MTYFDLVSKVCDYVQEKDGRQTYSNRHHRYFNVFLPKLDHELLVQELVEEVWKRGYMWVQDEEGFIVRILGLGFAYLHLSVNFKIKELPRKDDAFDVSFLFEEETNDVQTTTT